ncbi:MAG: hypothetical protein K6V97_03860 [Actinomycetia bacterium]|nr:hypothetical protein [Actinomycetes bacterium]
MPVQQVGNQVVYSGNYAEVVLNGVVIGAAKQWTLAYSVNLSPEGVIGTGLPLDLVPTLSSITVTLSSLFLNNQNLTQIGIEPPNSLADIAQIPPFVVAGYDTLFGSFIKGARGCVFDSNTITVAANAATLYNATILGTDVWGPG